MARHAKVLNERQLEQFESWVASHSNHKVRDNAVIQLSYRAGLRAGEIAQLRWSDVTDSEGNVNTDFLYVPSNIAKFGKRDRTIPMHPKLRAALVALQKGRGANPSPFVCPKLYDDGKPDVPMRPNTLAVYLWRLYRAAGFSGASSHSGRRTFVTKLARTANNHHCSLKDVQILAGHSRIETTELYVEPTDDVSKLVFEEA